MTPEVRDRLADAVEAELDTVVARVGAAARQLDGYQSLPDELVFPLLRERLATGVALLRGGGPVPDRLAGMVDLMAEGRVAQGVPLVSGVRVIDAAFKELIAAVIRAADRLGLPASACAEPVEVVTEIAQVALERAVAVWHHAELDRVSLDAQKRAELVRHLLEGQATDVELHALDAAGFPSESRFITFRARPSRADALAAVERALSRPTGGESLTAMMGTDVVGIALTAPSVGPSATIGVGPSAPAGSLARSFRVASRCLETAAAFGQLGTFRLEDLGLLVSVAADDELGQALIDRRLLPLVPLGEFGAAIRDSVAVYLADMRVDNAARRLHLHPNTLRYRIRKFEELTGTDLRRGDHVIEVWWALQQQRRAEQNPVTGSPHVPIRA